MDTVKFRVTIKTEWVKRLESAEGIVFQARLKQLIVNELRGYNDVIASTNLIQVVDITGSDRG
jgi:hypothetical protein